MRFPDFDPMGHDTPRDDLAALQHLVRMAGKKSNLPVVCVEVGSWVGMTAKAMSEAWPSVVVYCVDTFRGTHGEVTGELVARHSPEQVFKTFCRNMGKALLLDVTPLVGPSLVWAEVFPFPVDLVFIDGSHHYEDVKADIAAWSRLVRPGGILCGHDYGIFPGVTRAVDEIWKDGVLGRCVWWKRLEERVSEGTGASTDSTTPPAPDPKGKATQRAPRRRGSVKGSTPPPVGGSEGSTPSPAPFPEATIVQDPATPPPLPPDEPPEVPDGPAD